MKKIIFFFILIISLKSYSQDALDSKKIESGKILVQNLQKNSFLVGGSAQLLFSDGYSSLSVNPRFGYFLANNIVAGLNLDIFSANEVVTNWGPYFRIYFAQSKTLKGSMFSQVGTNITSGSGSSQASFNGKLGYAFFLNKNVSFENALVIRDVNGYNSISFDFGLQIHFKK